MCSSRWVCTDESLASLTQLAASIQCSQSVQTNRQLPHRNGLNFFRDFSHINRSRIFAHTLWQKERARNLPAFICLHLDIYFCEKIGVDCRYTPYKQKRYRKDEKKREMGTNCRLLVVQWHQVNDTHTRHVHTRCNPSHILISVFTSTYLAG